MVSQSNKNLFDMINLSLNSDAAHLNQKIQQKLYPNPKSL